MYIWLYRCIRHIPTNKANTLYMVISIISKCLNSRYQEVPTIWKCPKSRYQNDPTQWLESLREVAENEQKLWEDTEIKKVEKMTIIVLPPLCYRDNTVLPPLWYHDNTVLPQPIRALVRQDFATKKVISRLVLVLIIVCCCDDARGPILLRLKTKCALYQQLLAWRHHGIIIGC